MELYPIDLVIHLINILILFFVLKRLVYKPVVKFMRARSERIENEMQTSEQAEKKALALEEQYNQRLAECDDKAKQIIRENTQRANETAEDIVDKAKNQADLIIKEAHEKAEAERISKIEGMRDEIAEIAIDIAKQILQREISPEDNKSIINDFFRKAE
ncbi:MAG: F0F1 ATP synthase subunit B [Clostridiales bacterium]|nr:F0F1 ATP synthase subunit B [Clostridiales bacterium]